MAKESLSARLFIVGALTLCALISATAGHAAVGRTAGTFSVTQTGGATYSIPIFTPPGTNGLQPAIALTYNSNSGVGYVGRGWGISGLSSISRCPMTVEQDGTPRGVEIRVWDAYCLDGQRLRVTSGSNGQDGSVYGTEVAEFSRITAHGTTTWVPYHSWQYSQSGGPMSWTVERKDGTKYTYGTTAESRVVVGASGSTSVRVWMVSQIEDRSGNKVKFTYKTPDGSTTGTTHPLKIEWTQTGANSGVYVYSMEFSYSVNANGLGSSPNGYQAGSIVRNTDLLNAIRVKNSGNTVRKYALEYVTGGADQKILWRITECADEYDCLQPTTVGYQGYSGGFESSPILTMTGTPYVDAPYDPIGRFDYNGDGFKDLTYKKAGAWYVRMGQADGTYGSEIATGNSMFKLIAGDPTGSGRDVLLGIAGSPFTWHAYVWNGSSFTVSNLGSDASTWGASFACLCDVDGDGKDDLVYGYHNGAYYVHEYAMVLETLPSTSTGSTISFGSPVTSPYYPGTGGWFYSGIVHSANDDQWTLGKLDTNGDGREDIFITGTYLMCYSFDEYYGWYDCAEYPFQSVVTAGDNYQFTYGEVLATNYGGRISSAKVNDDGCADIVRDTYVALSACSYGLNYISTAGQVAGLLDYDGDGRKDVLVRITGYPWLYVQLSTGQGLSSGLIWTSLPSSCSLFVTDTNGDGLEDAGCMHYSGYAPQTITVYRTYTREVTPNLATSFTDGYGVNNTVAYAISTHEGYVPYSNATYPYQDVVTPQTLVRQVTASDGIGGNYTTTYDYFGAQVNVRGRGFVGFDKIESVDSRGGGLKNVREFRRTFPYSGILAAEHSYQPNGSGGWIPTNSRTNAVANHPLSGDRVFPYISGVVEDSYEVGGALNGVWITHAEVSNTFDTSGNLTLSTRTVTDKDTSSPLNAYANHSWTSSTSTTYLPNDTYWCLRLPTETTLSLTASTGEASVTRYQTFEPDYEKCRIKKEVVEPLAMSGALKVVASYGYDNFGNVNSVSVTGRQSGADMTARVSTTTWGSPDGTLGGTGQFPVKSENALNHITGRTFHSTFGSLLTETDPNTIVVANNTYDSFGRIYRVDRADGTYAVTNYYDCTAFPGCENGDPGSGVIEINKAVASTAEYDRINGLIGYSLVHGDQFDRPIVQVSQLQSLSGSWIRTGRQYDAFGRVHRETAPCTYYGCAAYWTTNTYDLLGRLTEQSRPRSDSVSTLVTTAFAYAGRTQTVTDLNGKVSIKVLDVNGWMRRSRDHDNYGQNFSYDAAGNLIGVTDSASNNLFSASYHYGAEPLQYSTTDMNLGTWSYTYNSLGELVSWTDAKSQTFNQTYDALSRVHTRTDQNTGQNEGTTTWTYGTNAGAYNIGRLVFVSSPGYAESYAYDSSGRLSQRNIDPGITSTYDYTYNNQGLLDTLTYPASTPSTRVMAKYCYAYGILQSVTDSTCSSPTVAYWTANDKNARGQTTQETLGNGVVTSRSFDAVTGRLNSIQSGLSGGTGLQNQSYLYDDVGNVTLRQAYVGATPLTESFHYDNLHRLDYSTWSNGGAATMNLNISYDAMGNIETKWDSDSGVTKSYSYHSTKKHAVTAYGAASYSYDANGNMSSRDGQAINWSSFNYPTYLATATENTTFYYGPDRQYYRQDYNGPSGSETTYYIGGLLEKVCPSTSCLSGTIDWRHYIVADGQTVAIVSRKSSGSNPDTVSYPLEDHQGSGSTLTNGSGTLLVRQSYEAFGMQRDGDDWAGAEQSGDLTAMEGISRRGYSGHSMLGRMGLIHMNGRVHDSITGRFLSADPSIPDPGFTQAYNRYAYVYNNPLSYIDPSGFVPADARCGGLDCGPRPDPACHSGNLSQCTPGDLWRMGYLCHPFPGGMLRDPLTAPPCGFRGEADPFAGNPGVDNSRPRPDSGPPPAVVQQPRFGLKDAAGIILPGYDAYRCATGETKCGFADWTMAAAGIIPVGKLASMGFKGLRAIFRGARATCCFAAGTLIDTAEGLKPIEQIEVGDLVWARDEETLQIALKPVEVLHRRDDRTIWRIEFEILMADGVRQSSIFETTDDHPWAGVQGEWLATRQLEPGTLVLRADSAPARVVSIEHTGDVAPTFNFEVADFHTYFVGELRIWVHNGGLCNLDDLSRAAGVADRNGLTAAGRALQKHGSREGSAFPQAAGHGNLNRMGQEVVDDILTTPGAKHVSNRFGGVDVIAPGGRGVRYDSDGNLMGFLEP